MIKVENLILASSSKQRLSLLEQMNIVPGSVVSPMIDESFYKKELPKDYSIRMAKEKGDKISLRHPGRFVLSADTVACCGRRILPKAETIDQAFECLNLISGRRHRVYTTVCLYTPDNKLYIRDVLTTIKMKRLSLQELDYYILSKQWQGKAGAFNIQGIASMFTLWLRGSYSSVMGLPLYETYCILSQHFKVTTPEIMLNRSLSS